MLRIFGVLLFVFGACFANKLENFDKFFLTSTQANQIKIHNELKNLYIQSVINDDEKTKIDVLKRLVVSSNALNLDDKSYIKELEESGISKEAISALKIDLKNIELKTQNTKDTQKPINTANLNTSTARVVNINKLSNGLEVILNTNLDEEKLKKLELNEKNNYRFIVDFNAIFSQGRKDYNFNDFKIALSQYDKDTTRLVFYSQNKENLDIKIDKHILKLSKINAQENAPKQTKQDETNKLYILKIQKEGQNLILYLNQELNQNLVKSTFKDNKIFREILSFNAIIDTKQSFKLEQSTITINQFDPKTVRIVASSEKDFDLNSKINKNTITLSIQRQNSKTQDINQNDNKNTNKEKVNTSKTATTKDNTQKSLANKFKASKLIVIDAGHGGKDSGALSDKNAKFKEKDIVLSTALKLGSELKKRNYKVLYTRSKDIFINLRDRTKFANDKNADLFISIHANAAPNSVKAKTSEGLETFFLSPARSQRSKNAAEKENQGDFEDINYFSKQSILNFLNREKIIASNKLAIDIQKNALNQTRKKYKIIDGGVREAPFWVLVGALMPAVLIEIGYITHPNEGPRIANKNFQDLLVKGIADGIDSYFYHNR